MTWLHGKQGGKVHQTYSIAFTENALPYAALDVVMFCDSRGLGTRIEVAVQIQWVPSTV